MKALMATAAFLILSAAAGAKPVPVGDLKSLDDQAITLARNDADIDIGGTPHNSRASLERDYFQAPQFNAGSFSCRLQSNVFVKTRLAQSCD